MDLPGWQAIYEELSDKGLEIVSAAQDTGGEEAAGEWFDRANATYTQIVDENHTISTLYNMVNVPTGVWIDENGVIVRPNETAYTTNRVVELGGKKMNIQGADYIAALRDWVAKGAKSEFVLSPEEMRAHLQPRSTAQADAEAGNEELANSYWEKAQALRPESWNYHRQDWSFTPAEAGAKWMKKFLALGDTEYYPPLDLPPAAEGD